MASEKDGDIKRVSTKDWARTIGYDPVKLFNKVPVNLPGQSRFVAFNELQNLGAKVWGR